MVSDYEALSILMHMKIFLSHILSYVNDIFNTAIPQIYLQIYFHHAWYNQKIAQLFHTCIRPTQYFKLIQGKILRFMSCLERLKFCTNFTSWVTTI